jgi:hypothetical protein
MKTKIILVVLAILCLIGAASAATFSIHGNHDGSLTLNADGTGSATVGSTTLGFTWTAEDGGDTVNGEAFYLWYKVPFTLFPANLTITSPLFPGTYATMEE